MQIENHKGTTSGDIAKQIKNYLRHWKWFTVSVILCGLLAFLYLRYTVPKYGAEAKIQILQSKNSGIDLFTELNILGGGQNEVQDEIEIINSFSNFLRLTKELNLNTRVLAMGSIRDSDLYGRMPVSLNFLVPDSTVYNADYEFYINLSSTTNFEFSEEEQGSYKSYAFGSSIPTEIGDLVVTPNQDFFEEYFNYTLKVIVSPVNEVARDYQNTINIDVADDFSNIVNLYVEDEVKQKASDILNSLINIYNQRAIEDKKVIADRTSDFINERIADIAINLSSVDQSAQELKASRGLTDIASEASINLNVGAANRQELANYQTQLNIASSMEDLLDQQDDYEVLPANIGLNDITIANTTEKYNQLALERKRLLKSSTEKSPIIQNLDQQLDGLKRTMRSSLGSTVNNLNLQVNTLSKQQALINSRIYSAPVNERALRDITRRQQTTESLYLYLLQKREESQLLVASASPKSKIIDSAYFTNEKPVRPRRKVIYVASIVLGLLIPFSVLYIQDLVDNKIHNMHDLEKLAKNTPILGELPRLTKKDLRTVVEDDRSVLSESLRIIRTNLDYLLNTNRDNSEGNVVFITSSTPGEGKTFLSTNLAMILSSTQKKVLLIGADIRNPKFYTYFTGDQIDRMPKRTRSKEAGLTDYIHDSSIEANDIINSMLVYNNELDVIYSGKIPPNPAELLLSDRVGQLIDQMSRKYDYVIVDTAPLMVVTDTLLISKYADLIVYVTRAGVTDVDAIPYPIKLKEDGKISNLSFVVNDVKSSNLGYAGKYGYGYGASRKKWWKYG